MPEMTRTLFVLLLLVLTSRCLRQYFRLYSTIVFCSISTCKSMQLDFNVRSNPRKVHFSWIFLDRYRALIMNLDHLI